MFIPKRIILARESVASPRAAEVIRRTHAIKAVVPIISKAKAAQDMRQQKLDAHGRWRYRKESVRLAPRGVPFIFTFASPGEIVEQLGTILNLTFQCAFDCEFCYLQTVMPTDHIIYTNVERLEAELAVEPYAHAAILSLWTVISFGQRKQLLKIPNNFNKAANFIRGKFQRHRVATNEMAVDLLYDLIRDPRKRLYKKLLSRRERRNFDGAQDEAIMRGATIKPGHLSVSKRRLREYYKKNRAFRPRLNTSEYSDFLGVDHLAGNTRLLMGCLVKFPEIELGFRTKSANVDELLKFDGHNRARVTINFNTEHVIEQYEHGTAKLVERIEAAKKVQGAKGFELRVVVEPVIMYDGWIDDYRRLARKIATELDPQRVTDFTFGTARFGAKLQARIRRNFPQTDLLDPRLGFVKQQRDKKFRYTPDNRNAVYSAMIEEVKKVAPGAVIRLGAENPELWERLGLNTGHHIGKSVYQYSNRHRRARK